MKKVKDMIQSKTYSVIINTLIILSILFIILDKFLNFGVFSYRVLLAIDIGILMIFAADFILRLVSLGKHYFVTDYGWVDFLAVLPILVPFFSAIRVFRIMRAARVIRVLRLLRVLRVLKIFKKDEKHSSLKQDFAIPVSAVVMLIVVVAGGVVISLSENILSDLDASKENVILKELEPLPSNSEKMSYLENRVNVTKVMTLNEVSDDTGQKESVFRKGDTFVKRSGSLYIVFSRKNSRRYIDLLEGSLYIIALLSILIISLLINRLVNTKIRIPAKAEDGPGD